MKQGKLSEAPRVTVYVRVGNIQQLFSSNAEMVRHLFKELLEDGKEHRAKDIVDYIFDKTRGRRVKDRRLTETAIRAGQRGGSKQAHICLPGIGYRGKRAENQLF